MKKPLQLTKDLAGFYRVRDRDGEAVSCRLPFEDAKEIFDALNNSVPRSELIELLAGHKRVFDELFGHCCSNGVFNAWNKPFDCTSLNETNHKTERVLLFETIYEDQWLGRYGASSQTTPLSVLTLSETSWVYVRGRGVYYVQPSHHNMFLSALLILREWENWGYSSVREAEQVVCSDPGRAADGFLMTTPGVFIKSSVTNSPLMISEGELTSEEMDFIGLYKARGLEVEESPPSSKERVTVVLNKFRKK